MQLLKRLTGHLQRCQHERSIARARLGYTPNLIWPHTFNEKVIRRKLRRPDPTWTEMADKVAARDLVAARGGASSLNEAYLITSRAEDIDPTRLPQSFVVKGAHGSGWNVFVPDARELDFNDLRARCRMWLGRTYGSDSGQTWHSGIPRRLIVERLLHDPVWGTPLDYKCFVFHGRVTYVQVDVGRFTHHTRSFYDREWHLQPWGLLYPPAPPIHRPAVLSRLIALAERLSGGIDFVRVDLYELCGEVIFGEFTLAPEDGWGRFWPDSQPDRNLGAHW